MADEARVVKPIVRYRLALRNGGDGERGQDIPLGAEKAEDDLLAIGERHGAQWYTAGRRSVKGHPHHPLYLKATSPLDAFDIRAYCAECL